jgi:integrase/recombinase XerD
MVENLFTKSRTRSIHLNAPMLNEREQYLAHMLARGVSRERIKVVASMLLNVIRLIDLRDPRIVEMEEINQAATRWAVDLEHHMRRKAGRNTERLFVYLALKWLRHSNLIAVPEIQPTPTDIVVHEFVSYLSESGYAAPTLRSYGSRVRDFIRWLSSHHKELSAVKPQEVDDFLTLKRSEGCMPRSIESFCSAFHAFFRYTELRGLTSARIYRVIMRPRVSKFSPQRRRIPWKVARQLLKTPDPRSPADLRATAMLFLCAIYGLRASEVVNLTLGDFDWRNETFIVRRAKCGRIQQYPIQFEVGEAILEYLRRGRSRSPSRNIFLTLKPPYRPVGAATLWTIIEGRIRRLGLEESPFGPHALRHACATELLRRGSSLQEIADLLGHRNLKSVSIYAKQDVRTLRQIADFSLRGVM